MSVIIEVEAGTFECDGKFCSHYPDGRAFCAGCALLEALASIHRTIVT